MLRWRKGKKKIPERFILFAFFLIWIILLAYWIQLRSYPSIRALAQSKVNQRLNECITAFISEEASYDQFMTIQHDNAGNIRAIQANIGAINRFKGEFCSFFLRSEQEQGAQKFEIPLGNLCAHPLFFGKGPSITVAIMPCTEFEATIRDSFTSAGVNQTLHSIYLEIEANVTVLSAAGNQNCTFSDRLLLCQTLIVGEVPLLQLQNGLLG